MIQVLKLLHEIETGSDENLTDQCTKAFMRSGNLEF